jgi:glycosyltransferase involved in cell wall biosynthesis
MLYVEPAPYIVGLVDQIRLLWGGTVDVAFIRDALTQPWEYKVRGPEEKVLSAGSVKALSEIRRDLSSGVYGLIHLAGWGHPVLMGTLLLGAWFSTVAVVETDTQLIRELPLWKRATKSLIYRPLFRIPAMFLPGGSRQAAYLRHYGVEESRIRIARMTVDVATILAHSLSMQPASRAAILRRYGIPEGHVKIIYLGRLEPHKGVFDLLAAFTELKREVAGVSLVIVGAGSLTEWVKQQASPSACLHYLGRLSAEAVWEAYSISDIFVLPSHFEPWGLVVNEAMASGLPVVVTDRVGCVDDLVKGMGTGVIVPAASPRDLFSALKMLATDPDMRRRMSAEARRLMADWTLENSARVTVSAWQGALQCAA